MHMFVRICKFRLRAEIREAIVGYEHSESCLSRYRRDMRENLRGEARCEMASWTGRKGGEFIGSKGRHNAPFKGTHDQQEEGMTPYLLGSHDEWSRCCMCPHLILFVVSYPR
jgi:hypothetical protein